MRSALILAGILLVIGCNQSNDLNSKNVMNINQQAPSTATLAPCPDSPNCVSSIDTGKSSYVLPLNFAENAEEAMNRLEQTIAAMARTRIVVREKNYLRAEFTSRWFRFVDDVEVLVNEKEGVLDIRSASRVGYSDFGVNRKRVESIRQLFSKPGATHKK